MTIFTVGHSTRPLPAFVGLLAAHGATRLVDVRTLPRSRRNPQFNRETLPTELAGAGIGYSHLPALGGLRRPHPGSVNTAWESAGFRGFADHMQTVEFEAGLAGLLELAAREPTAIMCAEAGPWRCHRSLIADALTARGVRVEHILDERRREVHALRPWARVDGTRVTYPGPPELFPRRAR